MSQAMSPRPGGRVWDVVRAVPRAGVPALVAAVAALAVALAAAGSSEEGRAAWYQREAGRRERAGDADAALVCYQWLIRNEGDTAERRRAEAKAYQARGEPGRALSILDRLAPVDQDGDAPAHVAAALLLLGGDGSEAARRAAELHLRRALRSQVGDEAASVLGRLYMATGRAAEAEPLLTRAAVREPELLLPLASLARDRGDEARAREHAERARHIFRGRTTATVDDPEARCSWAFASAWLGDFPAAVATLEGGRRLSDDPRYRKALAVVYTAWADGAPGSAPADPRDRVARLVLALDADPASPTLAAKLSALIDRKGPDADLLRSTLLDRMTAGRAGAPTYVLLGYDAHVRSRGDQARTYWEQAARLEPDSASTLNNIAWTLAHAGPPDLPRALELADRAVAAAPGHADYRDTRGFVLWKLGRYGDALADLRASLSAFPDRAETHLALADVYDHLGLPDPASAHRQAAARARGTDAVGRK